MRAWPQAHREYINLVGSEDWDSYYLRERGLIPNVVEMLGQCTGKRVLDAGAGTGWLFEHIDPEAAHACDLVKSNELPDHVSFRKEDVTQLSYSDGYFDAVVASLLLIFCEDLERVLREFYRVSASQGTLVVSLVHPYFYRTGTATADGEFLVQKNLAKEVESEVRIGEAVGPFPYYYRPYPVYLNTLVRSGWQIAETRDWFIDVEEYARHIGGGLKSNIRRSGMVPLYSFVRAIRS